MAYGSEPGLRCPSPRRALVGSLNDMVFSKTTSSNGAHRLGIALAAGPGLATLATWALQPGPCNLGLVSEKTGGSAEAWQGQPIAAGGLARAPGRLSSALRKNAAGVAGPPSMRARQGAPARHKAANPRPTAAAARGQGAEGGGIKPGDEGQGDEATG